MRKVTISSNRIVHGLQANWVQFSWLVLVNAFVGAMVGLERTILSPLAEAKFGLSGKTAILSFIAAFGISKAVMNYFAGQLSDRYSRKSVLIVGWLIALPVPFLLIWAPTWGWIIAANVLLGISQGLTWSTTIIMKIDLTGPKQRGLAMGLNEFAGYLAVAGSSLATGYIAGQHGLFPQPFYLGIVYVALGLILSLFVVKDTSRWAENEATHIQLKHEKLSSWEHFKEASFRDKNLSAISQAGLINNLNDGMAWGLFPLLLSTRALSITQIGWIVSLYPATWGAGQLFTGALSDRLGRKGLIAWGMWIQAMGIGLVGVMNHFQWLLIGVLLMGIGTAMVYPTLLAAIGDIVHPNIRASSVGIYRLWRDLGYVFGAILSGVIADWFSLEAAVIAVAVLTGMSGFVVQLRMTETLIQSKKF